ncbi:MAG: zinc ribbon domain-containing protein [Bacteroidaceae bacterium]|nr:zinc ribbon domain-containing protein [Bacteroidaceae bacterium]
MRKLSYILPLISLLALLLLSSCKHSERAQSRYYGESYNFIVDVDSMQLLRFLPSEASTFQDTVYVYENDRVAIADILTSDSLEITSDTSWVQLMRDATTFGWIEEMSMREQVVPADPISQGIKGFADNHLLVFLIFITAIVATYWLRKSYKMKVPIVHLNDIPSAYPAVLCMFMAVNATIYATIQLYYQESWQHFYYHPTLNPLAEHGIIAFFLLLVWVIIIMAVACVSEVFRLLKPLEATLYLLGLIAVCAIDYIIFSQLTLCYIGYPLLLAYLYFAIRGIKGICIS